MARAASRGATGRVWRRSAAALRTPVAQVGYGLTERERAITGLVAHGLTTAEIADRLHLSAYTVQDHLKAIFDKTGTGSRGELVAQLFLDHHLPQLVNGTQPR